MNTESQLPPTPWAVDGGGCELGITSVDGRETVLMFGTGDDDDHWFEVKPGAIPFIVEAVNFWHLFHSRIPATYIDLEDGDTA